MKKVTLLAALLLTTSLANNAIAKTPESLCKDVFIQSGSAEGILKEAKVQENIAFAILSMKNNEEFIAGLSGDDVEKFRALIGKKVVVEYKIEQYWNFHDGECSREEIFTSIKKR